METIEEAAEKHKEEFGFLTKSTANQKRLSFIAGATWEKEQSNSYNYQSLIRK